MQKFFSFYSPEFFNLINFYTYCAANPKGRGSSHAGSTPQVPAETAFLGGAGWCLSSPQGLLS